MKYTVLLTEETTGNFHATVLGLPDCSVEAETRSEALDSIYESISKLISRSEIIQLDVAAKPKVSQPQTSTPWD